MKNYNDKVGEILSQNEIKKVKFYYHSSSIVNNIFTVCLMIDSSNNVISRGVTICSPLDTFKRIRGRGSSFGRAFQALKIKASSESINLYEDRWKEKFVTKSIKVKDELEEIKMSSIILSELKSFYGLSSDFIKRETFNSKGCYKKLTFKIPRNYALCETRKFFKYKSDYNPTLTEFEKSYMM